MHALQDIALTAYISLLQNLHRLISPLLVPAVLDQPPFTILKGGGRNYSLVPKHCLKTTDDVTMLLDEMLGLLESNRVFSSVVKQFFIQTFYLINVTLFNHLMKGDIHPTDELKENEIGNENNLYTATNAFQIKVAISQLVAWIYSHSKSLSYHATKYISIPLVPHLINYKYCLDPNLMAFLRQPMYYVCPRVYLIMKRF